MTTSKSKQRTVSEDLISLGNGAYVSASEVAGFWPAILDWRNNGPGSRYDLPGLGVPRTCVVLRNGLKAPCSHTCQWLKERLFSRVQYFDPKPKE